MNSSTSTAGKKLSVAILLLCAGRSTRTGGERNHKLLSLFDGTTLLRRSAVVAVESDASEVFAVTGGLHDVMRPELDGLDVKLVHNPIYETGMASSIKAGWSLSHESGHDGIMIMLADMPFIKTESLNLLIQAFAASGGNSIVRATHDSRPGNPVILPRILNSGVMTLNGDVGARELLSSSGLELIDVELGSAAVTDVDTNEEIQRAGGIPASGVLT